MFSLILDSPVAQFRANVGVTKGHFLFFLRGKYREIVFSVSIRLMDQGLPSYLCPTPVLLGDAEGIVKNSILSLGF